MTNNIDEQFERMAKDGDLGGLPPGLEATWLDEGHTGLQPPGWQSTWAKGGFGSPPPDHEQYTWDGWRRVSQCGPLMTPIPTDPQDLATEFNWLIDNQIIEQRDEQNTEGEPVWLVNPRRAGGLDYMIRALNILQEAKKVLMDGDQNG